MIGERDVAPATAPLTAPPKVSLRGGRGFRLGAPVHSQVMADPAFSRKAGRPAGKWLGTPPRRGYDDSMNTPGRIQVMPRSRGR